jgi:hypothetical protein
VLSEEARPGNRMLSDKEAALLIATVAILAAGWRYPSGKPQRTRHREASRTRSLYRPRSVCRVTSGRQLKRAATALVPTPREVYPIILPCRHGPEARRRGVRPLVTMGMPRGRQI